MWDLQFLIIHKSEIGPRVIKTNVLKTGPVTKPEKLSVHSSLVGPMVEPRLTR